MRIIVDGDACPTKNIIEKIAIIYNIPVIMVFDTSHEYQSDYSTVFIVDKGFDSVDQKIITISREKDIIVTQDYGLASLVLAKGCKAIHQNGMIYDNNNIESLLNQRYISAKIRKSGKKTSNIKKRTVVDDTNFQQSLLSLILVWYFAIKWQIKK